MPTFEILDREATVVDTANSSIEAVNVVSFLNMRDRANSPYFCRPIVTATITYVPVRKSLFARLLGR